MQIEKNSAKKAKTHTIYKTSAGRRVPGVTTITGVMNKPALVAWSNKLGLQGIEVAKYVDDLAEIGTLAHYMVECRINSKITGKTIDPNLDDNSKNQIDSAENCYLKFLDWESKNEVKYIASEMKLVSEKRFYGGTVDVYCEIGVVKTLLDIKTSKGVYNDHFTQVAGGYKLLLEENGYPVEEVRILRLGRTADEGHEAEDILVPKVDLHQKRFLACLDLYEINKAVNRK